MVDSLTRTLQCFVSPLESLVGLVRAKTNSSENASERLSQRLGSLGTVRETALLLNEARRLSESDMQGAESLDSHSFFFRPDKHCEP